MANARLGTLNWAYTTKGRMTFRDQVAYVRSGIKVQLISRLPVWNFLHRHNLDDSVFDRVQIPDTFIVREAQAYTRNLASDEIFHHSIRAYFWGCLLNLDEIGKDGKTNHRLDEETFYLSCLFHDLGLTKDFHCQNPDNGCFTLDSTRAADHFFYQHPVSASTCDLVNNAITLHLNPEVSGSEHGWVAHYLNAGTACDVVGARYGQIARADRQHVLQEYPRGNLKQTLVEVFKQEARLHSCSRIALMNRLGFLNMIKKAPFES